MKLDRAQVQPALANPILANPVLARAIDTRKAKLRAKTGGTAAPTSVEV